MKKVSKKINFIKPVLLDTEGDAKFTDILSEISELDNSDRIIKFDSLYAQVYVQINVKTSEDCFIIELDKVDKSDNPIVKNLATDEIRELDLAEGEGLLYGNIFVYNPEENIIAFAMQGTGHPRQGLLKAVINSIIQDKGNNILDGKVKISRFSISLNKDSLFIEKVKKAIKITTATFVSENFNEHKSIGNGNKSQYDSFLAGQEIRRTTTIQGIGKRNIKDTVNFFIQDMINNEEIPEFKQISLTIDGKDVKMKNDRRCKEEEFIVDGKGIDKSDLISKLISAAKEYK